MPWRSGSPHGVRGCCQPDASAAFVSALPVGAESEHAASTSATATRLETAIRPLITTSIGPLGYRPAWPPHLSDATKVSLGRRCSRAARNPSPGAALEYTTAAPRARTVYRTEAKLIGDAGMDSPRQNSASSGRGERHAGC